MTRLPRDFYARDTLIVSRALLGQRLVHVVAGRRCSGLICETEAYRGPEDRASHAFRRTPRSAIMYGPPGYAYVYFIYGSSFCLNTVAKSAGQEAGAVLIRGLIPEEGLEWMRARRGSAQERHLTDGPGKLCQALGIDRSLNGADLTNGDELFIEEGVAVALGAISQSARVGVVGDELAVGRPWRYLWKPAGSEGADVSGRPSA
jgi:DNA-3-methyladenine glycosylase